MENGNFQMWKGIFFSKFLFPSFTALTSYFSTVTSWLWSNSFQCYQCIRSFTKQMHLMCSWFSKTLMKSRPDQIFPAQPIFCVFTQSFSNPGNNTLLKCPEPGKYLLEIHSWVHPAKLYFSSTPCFLNQWHLEGIPARTALPGKLHPNLLLLHIQKNMVSELCCQTSRQLFGVSPDLE